MADAQVQKAAPVDANGNPLPLVPGQWADLLGLTHDIPMATAVPLSDFPDYPKDKNPEIIAWILENPTATDMKISGAEADGALGICLPSGTPVNPGQVGLMSDPSKTFLFHSGAGDRTVFLTLFGKNLR
jgi:hypothetical protein